MSHRRVYRVLMFALWAHAIGAMMQRIQQLPEELNKALFAYLIRKPDFFWHHYAEYREIKVSQKEVAAVTFTLDGEYLLTGDAEGIISVWLLPRLPTSTAVRINIMEGHGPTRITALKMHSDKSKILSASYDHTVKLWDMSTSHMLKSFMHPAPVSCAQIDMRWKRIVTGCDGKVYLWDVESGLCSATFDANFQSITDVAFYDEYSLIATGRGKECPYQICRWSIKTRECLSMIKGDILDSTGLCILSADAHTVLRCSPTEEVSWIDMRKQSFLRKGTQRCRFGNFSLDKRYTVAAVVPGCLLHIFDTDSGTLLRTLEGQQGLVLALAISADNSTIATGASDGVVRLWTCKPTLDKLNSFQKYFIVHIAPLYSSWGDLPSEWQSVWASLPEAIRAKV